MLKKVLPLLHDLKKVPVLRALLPFVIGILLGLSVSLPTISALRGLLFLNCILILLLLIWEFLSDIRGMSSQFLFLLCIILVFLSSGYLLTGRAMLQKTETPDLDGRQMILVGKLLGGVEEKGNKFALNIACVQGVVPEDPECNPGNLRLYIDKSIDISGFLPGEVLIFSGRLNKIENRGNPGEFDYKSYMLRRGYRYSTYLGKGDTLICIKKQKYGFKFLALRFRENIISKWDTSDRGVAILSALTMGNKNLLDKESKSDFSKAGAMHLLAVSGLHVGMIWWVLNIIVRVPRQTAWRVFKVILILVILWFYAAVTGFSESVSRSVSMFSILSISNAINRRSKVYNSLFLSAFILLVINPFRILEAGFQLSYLAVFGIVSMQPFIARMYDAYPAVIRRIFDLLSVSIAAQAFTLPLTLHLFEQFPLYFLLTNLLAIPLVSIILGTFVITLPFLLLDFSSDFIFKILHYMIRLLDLVVTKISSLPLSSLQGISLNGTEAIILILTLLSFVALLHYRKLIFLILIFGSASVYFTYSSSCDFRASSVTEYCLFNHKDSVDSAISSALELSPGLSALNEAGVDVLFLGDCHLKEMRMAVVSHNWDVLVFREGFPLPPIQEEQFNFPGYVLADPGLSPLELWYLKRAFQEVYVLKERGAFTFRDKRQM